MIHILSLINGWGYIQIRMRSYHLNLMWIVSSSGNLSRMFLSISSILNQIIMNIQILSLLDNTLIRYVILFLFSGLSWLFTNSICSWWWNASLILNSGISTNSCSNMNLSSIGCRVRCFIILSICCWILYSLLFLPPCSLLASGDFI